MTKAYCPRCGRKIPQPEDTAFCPYCGASAEMKSIDPSSASRDDVRVQQLKLERVKLYASCFSALIIAALMAMNIYLSYRIFAEHRDGMIILLGMVLPVLDVPLMYVLYRATRRDDKGILDWLL